MFNVERVISPKKCIFFSITNHALKNHCIFTTPTSISWVSYIQILPDLWSQCLTSFPSPICHENYFNSLRSLFKFHLLNEAIPRRQWIGHWGQLQWKWKRKYRPHHFSINHFSSTGYFLPLQFLSLTLTVSSQSSNYVSICISSSRAG